MCDRGPGRTSRFYTAARHTFRQLAGMPEMGSPVASHDPRFAGLRRWPVRGFPNHLIFYFPTATDIQVIRVLHAARDIEGIFGSG